MREINLKKGIEMQTRTIKFRVWSNDGQMVHYFDLVNYMQSNEMGQEDLVPTLDPDEDEDDIFTK